MPPVSRGAGDTPVSQKNRRVVLCADDFGISDAVSGAILALLAAGRLSATSVMVNGLGTDGPRERLGAMRGIGVGLHLNLTVGAPLGRMPMLASTGRLPALRRVTGAALTGRLPVAEVRDEIARQLDAFEAGFGRPPDFVDGHQHAHALPGVRDALLAVLARRGRRPDFWLRDPADGLRAILARPHPRKALTVAALARGFGARARAESSACNVGFSGFSSFREPDLPATMERMFSALGPRPVVMCHPGGIDADLARMDPVLDSRPREAAYLASERFGAFLAQRGIVLAPGL